MKLVMIINKPDHEQKIAKKRGRNGKQGEETATDHIKRQH
jgi:hypothetical protein